ncbi:MAG: TRAP transporter substrate-binding protein [Syntrophales bacterium]|jgi:TRAP-type C4-dicarboxylate transport system substrate-binding protein|nr:TRAP transporter substrate-binding protein [Syntrophales bacterium]
MKKVTIFMILALFSVVLFSAHEAVSAPVIELKWSNYFPVPAMQSKICEEFIKEIEAKTQGKVKFSYFPAGTLLTAPKIYDGVVQGISDIGLSNLSYTYGRFNVTELLDLPLGFPNAWIANHVANDFIGKFRPKEWDKVHVLALHSSPVNVMMTVSKPVNKMEDLKGMTIRGQGYIGEVAAALGATPRAIATPETYDALLKNVIGGVYLPMETMRAFRLAEVTKHVTECWPVGQVYTFYLIMNKDTWNGLPEDVKKVFNEYPFEEKFANTWNAIDIDGKSLGMGKKLNFIQLSPDEANRWIKASETVVEKYVKSLVSRGFKETEVRGWIKFTKERITYWTAKQRELKIKSSTGPDDIRIK